MPRTLPGIRQAKELVEIDGKRIGGGQPCPVVRKLRALFVEMALAS